MQAIVNARQAEAWNGWEGVHWARNRARYNAIVGAFNDHVLDVGCGTGHVTLLAARRASRGHVIGIDLSAPMLERARAALSRGGVMFFDDPVAAFTNIRRGLRPGGRLAFLGPRGGGSDSDYARATATLKPLMRAPSPASRGMGSLVDPARIREVLDAAGFILGQGPVRTNLAGLDPGVVERTREQLEEGLEAYETPEGVRIPGAVWLVDATRAA